MRAERDEAAVTVEIAVSRERVWAALAGDLRERGRHVEITVQDAPQHLRLVLRPRLGEEQTLDYSLQPLGDNITAVTAAVHTRGARYTLKRLLSFGRIDDGYLDAVAVGLSNLQTQLEDEEGR